ECGLSGGAEYYRFTGADRRVGAQGPGRTLAVGQPEGLPAPLDHRGVALAIRADAIDPGRRIETQRLHLRTRQGHLEGAHLRVEAVEDLELTAAGSPAPRDHRGVARAIRADAIDPGRRIETPRLHLRTRQGHLEGAHLRVEAVEDLDLTVGVPHDAGAVGGRVADIALGLALVG